MAHLNEREWIRLAQIEDGARVGLLAKTRTELEEIRTLGVTATNNQIHTGFFGVSCPVFDSDNSICAAVTALGLSSAADLRPNGKIATAMKRISRAMSKKLGATTK